MCHKHEKKYILNGPNLYATPVDGVTMLFNIFFDGMNIDNKVVVRHIEETVKFCKWNETFQYEHFTGPKVYI